MLQPARVLAEPLVPLGNERFWVKVGQSELPFPYCSSRPLNLRDETVERVLFSIHGVGADAEMYLDRGLDAAALAPGASQRTLVVAPQFLTPGDYGEAIPPGTLYWDGGGRFWGGLSSGNAAFAVTVSSFAVLDQMLERCCDPNVFPNVKTIVIAGHSGGGQMVNRFAAASLFESPLAPQRGIRMRYIIMNPSSYVYFNEERAVPGTLDVFDIPSQETIDACRSYNRYGYGLDDLYAPYLTAVGADAMRYQYSHRNVIHLLGSQDNDPNSSGLARGCAAMLEGRHRLERGIIYFNYLQHYFGPDILEDQAMDIVPDAGHSGRAMMTSDIGVKYLFDYDPTPGIKYVDQRAPAGGDGRTWATAFRHPDEILPFARPGDEIRVAAGTYAPSRPVLSDDPRTASFVLGPGVQWKGGYAGLDALDPNARDFDVFQTVLSGDLAGDDANGGTHDENCYHVVTETGNDPSTLLEGFTIVGGHATGTVSPYHRGGGFYCTGNRLTTRHCRFVGNQAESGGAVYNRGGADGAFVHCRFEDNHAVSQGDGGAVYNYASNPIFQDCTFVANSAADDAGAVRNANESNPVFRHCVFQGNTTADNGGAVYSLGGQPFFEACLWVDNYADDNGGALYHEGQANATIINSLFNGNRCSQYGAAVFAHESDPVLLNCTVWGNFAAWQGGGCFGRSGSHVRLVNCLFWQNQAGETVDESSQISGAAFDIRYCLVQGWTGQLGGEGNFRAADPLCQDPDGPDDVPGNLDDDFRLTDDSPCIDAGMFVETVLVDFEDELRGFDANRGASGDGSDYDVGYDEYTD